MTHGEKEAFININCFSDLYDFFITCCLQRRNEREREREREREHARDQKVYLPAFMPTLPRHLPLPLLQYYNSAVCGVLDSATLCSRLKILRTGVHGEIYPGHIVYNILSFQFFAVHSSRRRFDYISIPMFMAVIALNLAISC